MITPRFKLTQTESTVSIIIRAPYSNLREMEVSVEENVFIFYSSPYYLRLHLPGSLIEDDFSKSSFDVDSGEFTFTFNKAIKGEHFVDLELITKFLLPKIEVTEPNGGRKIEILTNQEQSKTEEELNEEFGFALCGKNNFHHVSSEFRDVFEVDPREVDLNSRHKMRIQYEQGKFNIDHYLSDFIENDEIQEIIALESPWTHLKSELVTFTNQELDFLKDLPNKSYNLSDTQVTFCHCSLVDILFAYCYDRRTTHFEGSSESGWTIIKLAASFCWLDVFKEPKEAVISAFRRSVIYPLYRNFELSLKIFEDLKELLNLGEKYIIKCLIEMHEIFLKGDCCRYIINNLFIKDYIIYIMKWEKEKWGKIVDKIQNIKINRSELGLNLAEIEEDVCQKLNNLTCLNIRDDDSDDTESVSEDSDESTSETSDSSN